MTMIIAVSRLLKCRTLAGWQVRVTSDSERLILQADVCSLGLPL
jgi:hypothetical protein